MADKKNMLEGELENFLKDIRVSESDIYKTYQGGLSHDVNFTVIKGELKESKLSNVLLAQDSTEFKHVQQEIKKSLLELSSKVNMSMVDMSKIQIQLGKPSKI